MCATDSDGKRQTIKRGEHEAEIADEDPGPGRVSFVITKNGWLVQNVPMRYVKTEEPLTIWD